MGGGGSTSGHGHPMAFTQPAPLTTRSLATHLNQMQKAETGSTSSRVGAGGGGGLEGGMASHREKVPFDMAYAQTAFNQSRSRSASNANSDVQSTLARRPSGAGMMNPGPTTNASSGGTGRKSYGQVINQGQSMSIEALLSKPPSGNLMDALKELRSLILSEGIPTDADGHVCSFLILKSGIPCIEPLLMDVIVSPTDLRLVHPPRRSPHALQRIPRPRPSRCLGSVLQNPQRHLPDARHGSPLPPPRLRSLSHPAPQRIRAQPQRHGRRRSVCPGYERYCGAVSVCS